MSPLSKTGTRVALLIENYPNAYSDFSDRGTPCVFKSGPDWPVRKGPQAQGIIREFRSVYRRAIQSSWISIGTHICNKLESVGITWTSVNPLAYANAGEPKPLCPLTISINVKLHSLLYEDAVPTAALVKKILIDAGFPKIEVASVEPVITCPTVAKLLSLKPLLDDVLGSIGRIVTLAKRSSRSVPWAMTTLSRP